MNKKLPFLNLLKKLALIIVLVFGINALNFAQNVTVTNDASSTSTERNNARLIATGLDGKLHVVYYTIGVFPDVSGGIYHVISDNNGETWQEPELIDSIARNPSITFDSDNILHLVYKCGGINAYDIGHKTYNNSEWSKTDTVHHSDLITFSRPHIAIDSDKNLHCIWQRNSGGEFTNSEIFYKKHTQGSGWDSEPTNLSQTFGASEYPTLVTDSENNVYAFWKDSGEDIANDKMVLFRKYTVGTGWDENYTNVSNTTGNGSYATMDPCAIVDSKDNVHLVWKDSQTDNKEIFYKKYTDGVWGDSLNISNTANASDRPVISVDNKDNLFVVWQEKTDGIYYEIVYNSLVDEVWSDTVNISNTDNSSSIFPSIPVKTGNYLHAIWTEGENHPYSVMSNRIQNDNATGLKEIESQDFKIYPNPANNFVNIEMQNIENKNTLVEIVNISGQVIYSETIYNNFQSINLSHYSPGIYHVRVNSSIEKLVIY